jgi:hypothetical protein
MPPSKIRFVTACQQVLALGAVLAVLTPAASVISLDVVHDRREQGFVVPEAAADLQAYAVDPRVDEYPLTASSGSVAQASEPVAGHVAVGVTWGRGVRLDGAEISAQLRSRRAGAAWSSWRELAYDPRSAASDRGRPATEPLLVGEVDEVQVRVVSERGDLPPGLRLAVVDPGQRPARGR